MHTQPLARFQQPNAGILSAQAIAGNALYTLFKEKHLLDESGQLLSSIVINDDFLRNLRDGQPIPACH